jgi:predicted secreted hydrolase
MYSIRIIPLLVIFLLLLAAGCGDSGKCNCKADEYCNFGECLKTTVFFPEDAGYHDIGIEWWYYTGHIYHDDKEWGYEITVFAYTDLEPDGYMCHVGLTDFSQQAHYHADWLTFSAKDWRNDPTVLEVAHCKLQIDGNGNDHITGVIPEGQEKHGNPGEWQIDLSLSVQKGPVMHGQNGIIDMAGPGNESYYYSYTRMDVAGNLKTPQGDFEVTGLGWMDHQWGDFKMMAFKGWDWWSIQLENNYELMLFTFKDWDDVLVDLAGTIVHPDGQLSWVQGMDELSITPRRTWESPHTDGVYPLDWDIVVQPTDRTEKFVLEVLTHIDDQEMPNPAKNYWEGVVSATGTMGSTEVAGIGYVELTGYATDPEIPGQ